MRYTDFRDVIQRELICNPEGRTWTELRDHLGLPYERPCPSWTNCLKTDIGLVREKGGGRALVWKINARRTC